MTQQIWRERTGSILNAIIVYCLLLFVGGLMDLFDFYNMIAGAAGLGGSYYGGGGDPGEFLKQIFDGSTPGVGDIVVQVLLLGSFIWMVSGIKKFAAEQPDLQTQLSLQKVGSALWLNFAASVIDLLPIPIISGLTAFIMYICSYSMMMSAFRFLKFSPVFNPFARSAAGTLKSYSVWSIWGVFFSVLNFIAWIQFIRGWCKMHDGGPEMPATGQPQPAGVVVNVGAPVAKPVEATDEYLEKARSKTDEELKELLRHKDDYNPQLVKAAEEVLLERVMKPKEEPSRYMPGAVAEERVVVKPVTPPVEEKPREPEKPVAPVVKPAPEPAVKAEVPSEPPVRPTVVVPTRKSNNRTVVAIVVGVLLLVGGLLGYFLAYVPYAKDRDALRTYVYANNLFLRSSRMAGVEYNILDKIPYGSELITYEQDAEWASVKVNGVEGYVASPYLLTQADFVLLNGVWGDTDSKECIESSKCRMAILDFYKRNNLASGSTGWQVYTKGKDQKPNAVFYPRLYNASSKFTDFIFLVKENATGRRLLVGYSFDDETERPLFRFQQNAPVEGYIRRVSASYGVVKVEFDNYEVVSFAF